MSSFLSEYTEAFRVSDSLFARAYEGVGDRRRSVLKKWISQLYLFQGRERTLCRTERLQWDQGFVTYETTRPLGWTLIVLSPDFSSPAQLLAVLIPALLAGVPRVVVVREQASSAFPDALLAAMELAGQEWVVEMSAQDVGLLVGRAFADTRPGRVCRLGSSSMDDSLRSLVPGNSLWMPGAGTTAGIWFAPGQTWDTQTIAWTLPDTVVSVAGDVPEDACSGAPFFSGTLSDFMAEGFDALYLPSPGQGTGSGCPRVFGPGQEGGWIWPDLAPSTFMETTVCWESEILEQEDKDHDCE